MHSEPLIPRLYPITDTRLAGLSHVEQIKQLIDGGATLIQLRDKQASPSQLYEQAVECVRIAREHDVRMIINDRVDIALAAKAGGVHLGQDDMPPDSARILLGEKAIIGYSTHSVEQARLAADLPIDYIAIGPIFSTSTKEDPDPVVGLDGLKAVKAVVGDLKVVAIGGINDTNIASIFAAGADSAAVIGGLVSNGDKIAARIAHLISLTKPG